MNLKEKALEAKIYGDTKLELISLIKNYLSEYKKYDELNKRLFSNWLNDLIESFKNTFSKENFEIKENVRNYTNPISSYKTITANLYDLEFELLIDNSSFYQIRFLQNKPTTEAKNIILRPTIEEYSINEIQIINIITNKKRILSSINDVNKALETVNKAEYSVEEMNELSIAITKEITILLEVVKKLNTTQVKSKAINSNNHGINDTNKYGEFEHFSNFIDML